MKRSIITAVTLVVLLIPAMVFSAEKFSPAAAIYGANNTVVVPLVVTNEDGLMTLDIPLKWSDGVTLKEVTYEGTRVEYFDGKVEKIMNDKNTVFIGLFHQLTASTKPTLAAGEGPVANLVFEIDDPSVKEIKIEAVQSKNPAHRLTYIYFHRSDPDRISLDETYPSFESITVALSAASEALPTTYALEQNYPNPFNPSTEIGFSLPVVSSVRIDIYNVLGQVVNSLVNEELPAGTHTITWNGDDSDGNQVSSGVYFYRISANNFSQTKKMMFLK